MHAVKLTYPVQRPKIASMFHYSLSESCMVCAPPRLAYKSSSNFSRARSSSGRFFMFCAAKASKRARALGPTTGTGNEKRRTSIKSMLHPVEKPSTECHSSDTVNSLLTETLKQTPRVSSCVCKSFFDGLKDGHFYKTDTHRETDNGVRLGERWLYRCCFVYFYYFLISAPRPGNGNLVMCNGIWRKVEGK